jgi:hypothetical protein
MCVGAPCSLLRLAKSESARVTACFRGAGPLDAAAADPAALAAAAEADGCTAAHAHAPLGGGVDRKDDIAAKTVSAPGVGGVREASSCGVPQESTMSRQSTEPSHATGCSGPAVSGGAMAAAHADHAGVEPVRDSSAGSGAMQHALGGAGAVRTRVDVDAERGRQLRQVQDWVPEPDLAQVEPSGLMAAVVCPWQTPKEAADLLLMLARA